MIRRHYPAVFAALALLFLQPLQAGADDVTPRSRFAGHLRELGLMGRRSEGSAPESATIAYIKMICVESQVGFRDEPLDDLVEDHSYSRSLTVHLGGEMDDLLVIIVPLDGHADGPEGEGDAGIALAICAIQDLSEGIREGRRLPISLAITFLGGERRGAFSEGATNGAGTRWWIANIDESRATAVIYLSIDKLPGALGLRNASPGGLSPYWFYDRTRSALAASGFEYRLFPNRMQGYRLGLLARPGPVVPYLGAGIPAVELRNEEGGGILADPSGSFRAFLDAAIAANAKGFLNTWDRDYSTFQVGSIFFVIREGPYVIFLLAFTGFVSLAVLALSLVRRGTIPSLIHKLPRRLGYLGLLLVVAGLSFLSSWLCLRIETSILGSSVAWELEPTLFSIGRLVVILSLFLGLVSWLVSRRLLSPDPWFYEVAAIFVLGGDVLLFSFISLPLSIYFCWGLAVAFVSIVVRRPLASILAIVLLYLPFSLLAIEMVATPESSSLAAFLSPDPATGIVLVIAILPFASLTASPLLFLAPRGEGRRRSASRFFFALALVAESLLIFVTSNSARSSPIILSESLDQDSGSFVLDLRSSARLGDIGLRRKGQELRLTSKGDRASVGGFDATRYISSRIVASPFLDRVNQGISLIFPRDADAIELRLESKRDLTIYDCSLPYKVSLDGRSALIFLGPGGVNPLSIELTTSPDFAATLHVRASYKVTLDDFRIEGRRPLQSGRFTVDASIPVGKAEP